MVSRLALQELDFADGGQLNLHSDTPFGPWREDVDRPLFSSFRPSGDLGFRFPSLAPGDFDDSLL